MLALLESVPLSIGCTSMLLSAGFTCMWPLELHLRSTWIGRDVELKVRELLCDSVIHSKILPENSSPPPFHPHISRKVLVSSACPKASPVSQCKFPAEARRRVCRPLTAASGVGFGSLLPSSVRWWRSGMVPPPPPNVAPEVRSYADVVRHGLRVRAPPRRIRFAGDSRYGSPPPRPLLLSMLIGPPMKWAVLEVPGLLGVSWAAPKPSSILKWQQLLPKLGSVNLTSSMSF
jgi:hypothetical protein